MEFAAEDEPGDASVSLFEEASAYVSSALGTAGTSFADKDKLALYGLYKQATCGPCTTSKPFWDPAGRAKWCVR